MAGRAPAARTHERQRLLGLVQQHADPCGNRAERRAAAAKGMKPKPGCRCPHHGEQGEGEE